MKKIGIIGGLGPLATVDFFDKIVRNTPQKRDQDNIPILIYNNPQIPDRTEAILYGGESPVKAIIDTGKVLEDMGADFICIPCNTSFYFYNEIQNSLNIKVLNMLDLTVKMIKERSHKKVCILGTEGTMKTRIYHKKLEDNGLDFYEVDDRLQELTTEIIYDVVKANNYDYDVSKFVAELERIKTEENVDVFVLACTELPIFFKKFGLDFNVLDTTLVLALEAIKIAKEG